MTLEEDLATIDQTIKKVRLRFADYIWLAGVVAGALSPFLAFGCHIAVKIHDHMLITDTRLERMETVLGISAPKITKR